MCAKKKTGLRRSWRLAGVPLHTPPLCAEEKEMIADSFSVCLNSRIQDMDPERYLTRLETKTAECAVQAIANPLCEYFHGQYKRDTIIAVAADTAAIPINMVAPMARHPEFLMAAALWLLDYLEEVCGGLDALLAILPLEPDPT